MDELTKIPRRFVVAIDGSEGSARALQKAIQLATDAHAEVLAIHVMTDVNTNQYSLGMAPVPLPPEDWRKEQEWAFSQEWCKPLETCGLAYRKIFAEGPVAPTLIQLAKQEGAELIVLGSRGHGSFTEVLLGSVSHFVAHHSPIPVLIVPPQTRVKVAPLKEKDEKTEVDDHAEPVLTGSGIYF